MKADKLSLIAILYVIAWCVSPPLAYGALYRVAAIVALVYYLLRSMGSATSVQRTKLFATVGMCVYMIYLSSVTRENAMWRMGLYVLLLTGISFEIWSSKCHETKLFKIILLWSFSLYAIWNTTTLMEVLNNERIMRVLVQNSDVSQSYAMRGIGGYGYMYSIVAALPIGIQLLREEKVNWLEKLVLIYFVFTTTLISYFSQYFMAILLVVLIYVMAWKTPNKTTIISIAVFSLVVGLCMESILDFLISITDDGTLHRKLVDMQAIIVNGEDVEDSDFGERFDRYSRDISLIISNPIIGTLRYTSIGKHSTVLDLFAQYGLIIGYFIVKQLFRPLLSNMKGGLPIVMVSSVVIFIIAILNSFPITAAVPLCFIIPSYCIWKSLEKY